MESEGGYKTGKTGTRSALLSCLAFVDPGASVIMGLGMTDHSVVTR